MPRAAEALEDVGGGGGTSQLPVQSDSVPRPQGGPVSPLDLGRGGSGVNARGCIAASLTSAGDGNGGCFPPDSA